MAKALLKMHSSKSQSLLLLQSTVCSSKLSLLRFKAPRAPVVSNNVPVSVSVRAMSASSAFSYAPMSTFFSAVSTSMPSCGAFCVSSCLGSARYHQRNSTLLSPQSLVRGSSTSVENDNALSAARTSESSSDHPADASTLIAGPSLLTATGAHRPSPSLFYLPGLRSLPFWTAPGPPNDGSRRVAFNDPVVTAAISHLESNFDVIKSEYLSAVLGQQQSASGGEESEERWKKPMEPDYDLNSRGSEHTDNVNNTGSLHTGTWDWHSYLQNGNRNPIFEQRCPKTSAIINELHQQGMLFETPFSFCFFSTLHGKSGIKPHSGPMNLRLRVHLPLMVPKDTSESNQTSGAQSNRPSTGIQVANQIRQWHEGQALVLDDSYIHSVWNNTAEPRVLLLLDLWHPDVRKEEKERIGNMFAFARDKGWIGKK